MDSNSGNTLQPDSSGSHHSRKRSSGHSHNRHHRHSSSHEKPSVKQYQNVKRHRLEEQPKRERLQKIETFFTKNILPIFGIIFIAGAVWFAIITWNSMNTSVTLSVEKSRTAEQSITSKINSLASAPFIPAPLQPSKQVFDASFIFIMGFALIFILATLGLSIRRKNILLKLMSFVAWILFAVWLLIRFFGTMDSVLFYGFSILSLIFFGLYFLSGFVDSYVGRRKWKYRSEYVFILLNSLFYFFAMMAVLFKSGHRNYLSVFIFLLSTFHLVALYYSDKRNINFNKVPYLISALIITCSFLPFIIQGNSLIIFLAPVSVFLILFSKYSFNQTSVIFSLMAMLLMAMIYLYQWIFSYLPEIIIVDGVQNYHLYYKGIVSSIFILTSFSINNNYLKKFAFSFSKKWLSKGKYMKFLKGILLLLVYLSGYWIFNFLLAVLFRNENLNLLIWFSFNCLYFIFYIPLLARQRSSFSRMTIILAMISSLAYFTIVHFNILSLRHLFLETKEAFFSPFLFHYIVVALFVMMLFTLLRYFKRAFPGKKTLIKSFWVYFYLMCMFLFISEFDHAAVLFGFYNGVKPDEVIAGMRKIPYSLLVIFSSMIVLITGFVIKSRFLRLFSLFILASVLIKVLVYDVNSLTPQAKMILFLIMGVVLLGISVSYPKIKRSFFEKDSPQTHSHFSGNRKQRN
jgi:hypothetical protein